jgi:hypothetical protein
LRAPTLAGIAVVLIAGAVMAVIALVDTASSADGAPATPATPTAEVPDGATVTLALTSNMYAHPSRSADLVAVVPSGRIARVTGRTEDNEWLRVVYPANSSLEGWIVRGGVVAATEPDLTELPAIAAAGSLDPDGASGGLLDDNPLPDLTVSSADVIPNGTLEVRISNVGRAAFADIVEVRVTGVDGELLAVVEADLTNQPLIPGRSASVNTGVAITRTGLYVIDVDRDNHIEEENEFNNTLRVLLVGTGE